MLHYYHMFISAHGNFMIIEIHWWLRIILIKLNVALFEVLLRIRIENFYHAVILFVPRVADTIQRDFNKLGIGHLIFSVCVRPLLVLRFFLTIDRASLRPLLVLRFLLAIDRFLGFVSSQIWVSALKYHIVPN